MRTQIYLGPDDEDMLDREVRRTGASRSELIRRAIHRTYGVKSSSERLPLLRAGLGLWSDREFTGAEYVETVRHDLNDRLRVDSKG
ncbi:MAG TPA: CopG family transcriptional regulator [Chloroflexota bacterium]|nr:CopG family transcriptional regulator [Chloroflexota bacterium]